jgi:6-phosphogluconolactonase
MTADIARYRDPAAVVAAAADVVTRELCEAVERRGKACVVLAGGETPRSLYRRLAESREGLPWAHVWWFFGDERWVPQHDPLSNFAMVEQALFSKVPIPRSQIVAVPTDAADPVTGAMAYEAALRAQFTGLDWPEFDLVLMGLGADGHTASLFPGDPALAERTAWVASTRAGQPVPDRVTLTIPVFTRARSMFFLVTGAAKADALAATLTGPRDPTRWPAQAVIPASGRCRWLVDHAAAAKLPSSSS